jgi:hypothetical protein
MARRRNDCEICCRLNSPDEWHVRCNMLYRLHRNEVIDESSVMTAMFSIGFLRQRERTGEA